MNGFETTFILEEVTPVTERKVMIPSNITFKKLHEIISIVFNLNKNNKYNFYINELKLEITDTGSLNRDIIDSRYEKIDKYFQAFEQSSYTHSLPLHFRAGRRMKTSSALKCKGRECV